MIPALKRSDFSNLTLKNALWLQLLFLEGPLHARHCPKHWEYVYMWTRQMMPFFSGSLYYFDINSKFDVHSKLNKTPPETSLVPIFTKKLYRRVTSRPVRKGCKTEECLVQWAFPPGEAQEKTTGRFKIRKTGGEGYAWESMYTCKTLI